MSYTTFTGTSAGPGSREPSRKLRPGREDGARFKEAG